MEPRRFDGLTRALGRSASRRGALAAMAALLIDHTTATAKRRCQPDSPAGQCCRKRRGNVSCTCLDGGIVCGPICCMAGEACRSGRCAGPEPPACIAFGEACKGAGRVCCDGLECASGQGGTPPACLVPAGGPCERTADCVYGASCERGVCVAERVCEAKLGEACTPDVTFCCAGSCGPTAIVPRGLRQPRGPNTRTPIPRVSRCCVPQKSPCRQDAECCCPTGTSFCLEGMCDCT